MKILKHSSIVCLIITALTVLSTNGCIKYTRFRGLEPNARPLQEMPYDVIGEASSNTSSFNLLWFIPVTPRMDMDRALSDAISQKGGDAIIDVRWWRERQYWILGTVNIIHIKGKVIKYRTGLE